MTKKLKAKSKTVQGGILFLRGKMTGSKRSQIKGLANFVAGKSLSKWQDLKDMIG